MITAIQNPTTAREGLRWQDSSFVIEYRNNDWALTRPGSRNVVAWGDTAQELVQFARRNGAKRVEVL